MAIAAILIASLRAQGQRRSPDAQQNWMRTQALLEASGGDLREFFAAHSALLNRAFAADPDEAALRLLRQLDRDSLVAVESAVSSEEEFRRLWGSFLGPRSPRPARLAEDLLTHYAGIGLLDRSTVALAEPEPWLSHHDPRVRQAIAIWLEARFVGPNPLVALFPSEPSRRLTFPGSAEPRAADDFRAEWSRTTTHHLGFYQASPIGKALARLRHNASYDPDPAARAAAGQAWRLAFRELDGAIAASQDTAVRQDSIAYDRRKIAERWLGEIDMIQLEWRRIMDERARALPSTTERALRGEDPLAREWSELMAVLGRITVGVRQLIGVPPYPTFGRPPIRACAVFMASPN